MPSTPARLLRRVFLFCRKHIRTNFKKSVAGSRPRSVNPIGSGQEPGGESALARANLDYQRLALRAGCRRDALQDRSFYQEMLAEFLAGHSSAFDDDSAEADHDLARGRPQELRGGSKC